MWLTKLANQRLPVDIGGAVQYVSEEQLGQLIKRHLLESPSILHTFQEFDVDPSRLENLAIQVVPMEDKYAETDAQLMKINPSLFEEGRFFQDYFFVIAHEIVHWLSRIREQDAYLNDPEETLGFCLSIAYELDQNSDLDEIYNKVFPKIEWHFHSPEDARNYFKKLLIKAKKMQTGK